MVQFTKENTKMMKCMDRVYTNGQMAANTSGIGKRAKWMEKELSLGQMVPILNNIL